MHSFRSCVSLSCSQTCWQSSFTKNLLVFHCLLKLAFLTVLLACSSLASSLNESFWLSYVLATSASSFWLNSNYLLGSSYMSILPLRIKQENFTGLNAKLGPLPIRLVFGLNWFSTLCLEPIMLLGGLTFLPNSWYQGPDCCPRGVNLV